MKHKLNMNKNNIIQSVANLEKVLQDEIHEDATCVLKDKSICIQIPKNNIESINKTCRDIENLKSEFLLLHAYDIEVSSSKEKDA